VLFRPKRSTLKSRSQVSLERTYKFKNSGQTWTGVPVIAANMDTVGTFEMAERLASYKMLTAMHKHYTVEEWTEWLGKQEDSIYDHIMVSSGTSDADFDKVKAIVLANPKLRFICIDVANGYSQHFVDFLRRARADFPSMIIIAGNVVTGEMAEELILSGADVVKVGIGPGSVCTTRVKTGVGYPQLSAAIECADAAHGLGGHVISDGGCTCAGDVSKAFGAGSDFVMLGGMLAGHEESGGELVERDGKMYKLFYGMSSSTAMNKHSGGVANYRASEGKTVEMPFKGPVDNTVQDILGGVRSTCTYVGADSLKELSK
ncbi:GMP reductase, partial [Oleiphilus sp. HI0066]|uniref:GMP reductase n=2 Tax=Oleiphilus TaxID=141450 RepID=UPI0007C396DB